jgi:hypothetical protein
LGWPSKAFAHAGNGSVAQPLAPRIPPTSSADAIEGLDVLKSGEILNIQAPKSSKLSDTVGRTIRYAGHLDDVSVWMITTSAHEKWRVRVKEPGAQIPDCGCPQPRSDLLKTYLQVLVNSLFKTGVLVKMQL